MVVQGGTLIYSPAVSIVIESARGGIIDVSDDIAQGTVTLRQSGSHTLNVTLNNPYRKYDGIFAPNDRVVVQLKRFRWLQVMSGYLTRVPHFSTFPRSISITGECSLKALKNFPWDAGSERAFALIHGDRDREAQDGISDVVRKIFTEVVRWPEERVHIGRVPEEWVQKFQSVYDRLQTDQITAQPPLGTNPIIAGKPIEFSPLAGAGPSGGGIAGPWSPVADENLAFVDTDLDVVLKTIRQMESGNNYRAINKGDGVGDWATGAYQFIDSSWDNYWGYARAYLAPPDIQDAKAKELVYWLINKFGKRLMNVPVGWYLPSALSNPAKMDQVPAANEGNTLTPRQYGHKWLTEYRKQYREMRGGSLNPPLLTDSPGSVFTPGDGAGVNGVFYPIPAGVNSLPVAEMAWGGYSNGRIPTSAMSWVDGYGYGHPIAAKSYGELLEASKRDGVNLRGYSYRSYEQQAEGYAKWPDAFAPPGRSNHGWGLAIDINVLVPGNSKYPNMTKDQLYDTAEYKWMVANGWRWGWGQPQTLQRGGSRPEPWHWEFFAFPNYKNGGTPTTEGYNPFDGQNGLDPMGTDFYPRLFEAFSWWEGSFSQEYDINSNILWGYKALMNDVPVLDKITELLRVTNRVYCSAPNGDFIAWFPDYWGEYGIAGAMDIETIELKDFAVMWSDDPLVTHQYVEGGFMANAFGPLPSTIRAASSAYTSSGVVTIEMPGILKAITNMRGDEYPWLSDPEAFLRRFGARIDRTTSDTLMGSQQEFWYAISRFTDSWASQFAAVAPLTFMPELFPGMLLRIPEFKVQFYVQEVTHSFSMVNDVGFETDVTIKAPSATDGSGFYLFPRGGLLSRPGGGGGGGLVRVR